MTGTPFLFRPLRLAALFGAIGTAALAQTAPEIVIAPPSPPATEAPVASEPSPESAAPAPDAKAAVAAAILAIRDGSAEEVAAQDRQVTLGLRPLERLPQVIGMGASLPGAGILRLTGETAAIDLGLWLPDGMSLPGQLTLALRSSINVLPETAALAVSVNGAAPAELPLDRFDGFGPVSIDGVALVPGFNRISLSLRQPHRIFCGPEASFDVWTELDLGQSGLRLPADALIADAASFGLLLGNQLAAGQPLPLVVEAGTDPALLRQLGAALGTVMQGQGQLAIRSFYDPMPGQDARVALVPSQTSRASYRRSGRGGITLVIEYAGGVLPDLGAVLPPPIAGHLAPVPMVSPGQPVSLADLGQPDLIANTRYYRHDLDFDLPDDWLLLANQKAELRLHYGFASDLPKGAMLLVKANENTVRLLPLDRDGGRLVEPLAIPFGARLLHPGQNRLSFEMMVPGDPATAACPLRQTDMLVVTSETSLEVPRSPAMQLGGISTPLAGLDARRIEVAPGLADHQRLGLAAAQLAAGLAPAARVDPRVSLTLVDISGYPQARDRLSLRTLQDALFPPAAAAIASPAQAITPATVAPTAATPGRYRLSVTEADTAPDAASHPAATGAGDDSAPEGDWLERQRAKFERASFMSSREGLESWLQQRHGTALVLPVAEERPEDLWLVLGPEAEIGGITRALNGLRATGIGEGRAALLSNDGSWQVWSSPQLPQMDEPVSPLNLMPVLGNYASWSPLLFAALLLGLAVLSVFPALVLVVTYRNRRLR